MVAQDIPLGTWRTHFSYKNGRLLEETDSKIFCAFENGLLSYDKNDQSIRVLSKSNGLSGVQAKALAYDQNLKVLLLGYESGLIDLVFEDRIETIRTIRESSLLVEKQINDAIFIGNRAYVAAGIGVVVIDVPSAQIIENYFQIGLGGSQVEVLEIEGRNDSLFVRTSEGIQSGGLSQNLLDFSSWRFYPASSSYRELYRLNNQLYCIGGNQLLRLRNTTWVFVDADFPSGATTLFGDRSALFTFQSNRLFRFENGVFKEEEGIHVFEVTDIVDDFYATEGKGLARFTGVDNGGNAELSPLIPSGPISDRFSRIKTIGDLTFGFHAPQAFGYSGQVQIEGYSLFEEGVWTQPSIENFRNIDDVTTLNGSLYFSSIGDGLYLAEEDEILADIPGSRLDLDTVISALASRAGNLWAASFDNPDVLHQFDGEGWVSISNSQTQGTEFTKIEVSRDGTAWCTSTFGTVHLVSSDQEQFRTLNSTDGLPGGVLDVAINIDDRAWITTLEGIAQFPFASSNFGDSDAIRPTFNTETLFSDKRINAVVTDGGNRVWFGTEEGLQVFDDAISEQVFLFTQDNSPLPSNAVLDLSYNTLTGEVFVATDKGLASFRSASSNGRNVHRNVRVFPNPVLPNYDGLVGITGLARNVTVKITDLNGHLVKEMRANGGTTSWDLRTFTGSDVGTGIYLFFSATDDGEEAFVGKIAVVR